MRRVVQLAGCSVELSADDERRWQAVDALFGGCTDSDEPAQVRLWFDQRQPELPDRTPDLRYTATEIWLGPDGAACRSAAGVAARRHGDDVHVGGPGPDAASDLATAFRRSVQHVLADVLAEHGRHALHAASIRCGRGVVIALGGTGAGKSTLAYAASRRSWPVLSDDLTFLAGVGDDLVAWGLPKPINVPVELMRDGGTPIPDDPRRRVRVPLDSHAPDVDRVHAVVLVDHSSLAGYAEPVEAGPALLKTLLPSFPLAPDRDRLRQLFPIAAGLSRLPAWTLHHDADPERRLDVAATLLAEITAGAQ